MKINPLKIIGTLFLVGLIIIIAFIWMLSYQSKTDLSSDSRFAKYLNTPLKVKVVSTLRWNKNNIRFTNYTLHRNEDSNIDLEDVKSVKKYQPETTIVFHTAKSYKSMHVGETFYLLGSDTLDTGEIVEFEYYTASNYTPEIWETEQEFLKRIKN